MGGGDSHAERFFYLEILSKCGFLKIRKNIFKSWKFFSRNLFFSFENFADFLMIFKIF